MREDGCSIEECHHRLTEAGRSNPQDLPNHIAFRCEHCGKIVEYEIKKWEK